MVLIHHITCYIDLRGLSLISTETTNKINHFNTLDKLVNNTHLSTTPVKYVFSCTLRLLKRYIFCMLFGHIQYIMRLVLTQCLSLLILDTPAIGFG